MFDATRLQVLADLLAGCACYRLDMGLLERARRVVLELFVRVRR